MKQQKLEKNSVDNPKKSVYAYRVEKIKYDCNIYDNMWHHTGF